MTQRDVEEDNLNLREIPPVGHLFVIIFTTGLFFSMDFNTDMNSFYGIVGSAAILSTLYFVLRFKQIAHEQGLRKAFSWSKTSLEDREADQFNSPDLEKMMPKAPDIDLEEAANDFGEIVSKEDENGKMTISNLRGINEYEFEEIVGNVWSERGWETQVTRSSNDRGIDIVAEKQHPYYQKILIQAKRYSAGNKVGSKEIQQYYSLKDQEDNVDQVLIITTSSFTKPAERRAQDLNVKLINGEEFLKIYKTHMEDEERK
ncbi:restriction endonuclease [Candidatus Nanosalina sp. VS9-1]|uniref:restriction endonuclease n=1 Tax=Candidatus Nanosalina sp. VS9-1 TaxID=3388566 RepID=UPI0039E19BEE